MKQTPVRLLLTFAGLLAVGGGVGGCAKDPRPKYIRPDLPKGQYATIDPTVGAFSGMKTEVEEVDGARVAGFLETYDVRVAPGEHVIGLRVYQGGTHSQRRMKFRFTFRAGHVYEVGFNTTSDHRPIMRDKTDRTVFYLDEPPQRVAQ